MTTVQRSKINSELSSLTKRFPISDVQTQVKQLQLDTAAKNATLLLKHGDVVAGFKSIGISTTDNDTQTFDPIPALMTGAVPGVTTLSTSSQSSNISTLTGKTISNGLTKAVIASGNPEGIQKALEQSISASIPQMTTALQSATDAANRGTIAAVVQSDLKTLMNTVSSSFTRLLKAASSGENSLLNMLQIFVAKIAGNDSTLRTNSIVVEDDTSVTSTTRTYTLEATSKNWNYSNTPKSFRFEPVSTEEELELELSNAKRDITEAVIDWTGTFSDINITAKDIHEDIHRSTGIQYHYIIQRDGTIQRGRPISIETDASFIKNNHHRFSVMVGFVGGYNAMRGTENPDFYLSYKSLTSAQLLSFDQFCHSFYRAIPGGQILGRNAIEGNTYLAPGFDIIKYVRDKFGRGSVFTDPTTENSFSTAEIIEKRITDV